MVKVFLFSFSTIISAILVFSCDNHSPSVVPVQNSGKMNFACLYYDSTALEYRLDSIHNRGLVLQFCLEEAGNNNTTFQLISYAFDTLSDYNNSWMPDTLGIVQDSISKTFDGPLTIGNNIITREQLYNVVRDANGNRFSYDYVLFTPVVEGVFNHLVYIMVPVKNDQRVPDRMQMTSPMPPSRVWQ